MDVSPLPLAVSDLTKRYAGAAAPVLRGVSLEVAAGESVALTGESGSGKSTLLHLAAGLDTADGGAVRVLGQDLSGLSDPSRAGLRRSKIGIVFQQFNLIPSLSVGDNLSFQARLAGQYEPGWCAALAERLGLTEHLRKFPEQLSGGQQQRLAIGRALAPCPALVLADEPTGNLDEETSDAVLSLMLELTAETGAGLLMVTHSLRIAARMDRHLRLEAGVIAP